MNDSTTEKLVLSISRVIRAPRERVFSAFSSIDELKKWFGPGECHVIDGEIEFRSGGAYRFGMHTTDFGRADLSGIYNEIVLNTRIRCSWAWRNNEVMEPWGNMSVTVQFADHKDGSEITIQHEGLINAEVRDGHSFGWNGCFDKLTACLES